MVAEDPNSNLVVTMPNFDDAEMVVGGFEDNDDGEDSSGTTTTITKRPKVDRARTLISERKRRGRMKDKLYALRSLVPNITKMDKASIVGDAILYVQNLQMQAKKLKAEIASLEAPLDKKGDRNQEPTRNPKKNKAANKTNHFVSKIIIQMALENPYLHSSLQLLRSTQSWVTVASRSSSRTKSASITARKTEKNAIDKETHEMLQSTLPLPPTISLPFLFIIRPC